MNQWPCIYCRRLDVPRTREHVLQAAFGASATLPTEVCADCNDAFSSIDKSFVEAAQFYHLGDKMLRGLGLGRAVLEDGTSVNARLRPDDNGEFPPQLYEAGPTVWKFLGHREADLHQMLAELAKPTTLQVKSEVVANADGVPRLAILRSAPRIYLVQGTDGDVVERFAAKVRSEGMRPQSTAEPMERSSNRNPEITYRTSLLLEPFCRAMAKVALNFVCHRLGPEVALRSEFDGVRRYARYGEGSFMDYAVPTALNRTLEHAAAAFVTADHHALYLMVADVEGGRREAVFIVLRGKAIGRLDLTRGNPGLPAGTWLITRFDEAKRSYEDLTFPNDMHRAVLNPAVLGLQDVWPQEWA